MAFVCVALGKLSTINSKSFEIWDVRSTIALVGWLVGFWDCKSPRGVLDWPRRLIDGKTHTEPYGNKKIKLTVNNSKVKVMINQRSDNEL
jgi:hypothetical protein